MVKAGEGETAQEITRRVRAGVEPGMDGFFQKMMKILLRNRLIQGVQTQDSWRVQEVILVSATMTSTVYKLACARDPYSINLRILYKNHIGG